MPDSLLEVASIDHAHQRASRALARGSNLASTLLVVTTLDSASAARSRALRRGNERMAIKSIHGHDIVIRGLLVGQGDLLEDAEHTGTQNNKF